MYHNATTAVTVGATTLPFTGFNIVWALLASFALFAAAGAVHRLTPRREG
jgi:hypothetical protein